MKLRRNLCLVAQLAAASLPAYAQTASSTSSPQVVVPAFGEVVQANDQVQATLLVEEQDKDKAAAASRVNQKMNQGIAVLRKQDAQAKLKTHGYYTYAIYPEDQPHPVTGVAKPRQPIAWRVGQYLEMTTTNLTALPQTISAAQSVMALNGLHFGLSPTTSKKLDAALIDATYKNLTERINAIAVAMGRNPSDAVLDTLDFEGSGNYVASNAMSAPAPMMMRSAMAKQDAVAEPSFEPGETTLNMRAVGKLKFK